MKKILLLLFVFACVYVDAQIQYLGAPNVTVVNRGNFRIDSILYLPKREKTPTDTGALRYQISDSSLYVWTGNAWRKAKNDGTVTSVGLTMPTAFAVANSPVTSAGTLAVTATGSATEYIRGDGTLGTLPTSGGGGGSGVNYYLNGSVSQGTIGGSTYYEMNKVPVVGTGTNFTASADGLIAQFITDAGDPNRLLIPAGAWNFELYFSASSAGGTPTFYVELLKYDGTTFTSIASSSANPIPISNGTVTSLYVASLAVTETVLTATDRLAIRVYTNVSGRTITLHTEDNNLAQVITTFAGGVVSLNGLTANDQFFATGTTGTNFNIASTSATHTFNLPTASATNRGALSSTDWSTFNNKVNISDTAAMLTNYIRHAGNGLTKTGQALSVDTSAIATRSRVQKGIDSVASVRVGGSGITGYIPKWTATRTQDTSQLFQSAGFVAIGNVTPAYKLDISGTLRNTTGAAFATSSGNVLIGTTTDGGAYKLDVVGNLRVTTGSVFNPTASSSNISYHGTTTSRGISGIAPGAIQVTGSAGSTGGITIAGQLANNANGDFLQFVKSRGTTNVAIQSGDNIGGVLWGAADGTNYLRAAQISALIDATPGTNDMPTSLRFATTRDGTSTPTNVMDINNAGEVIIMDNPADFGNFRLQVGGNAYINGSARVTSIDSTATGINMLYADATGVIKKAAVPSGGGGSVTSITAGTGLTGGTITTSGTIAVDTASIATRARVQKGIDSVTTLANTKVSGTGISGYFPKWTGATTQDTSQLFQLGRNIGIGTATPTYRIHLPDAGNVNAQAMIAGTVLGSDGNGQTIRPSGSLAMALFGQADIGYIYGAAVSSTGRWGINTRSLNDATFNVDGSVKIVTIDSTSTARNMLYQDANGVIKKAAVPSGGSSGTINTSEADISSNYTVTSTDHFVFLPQLETAGRNIVLPTTAADGRQLIFFNTSNNATHKWTFTNEDVEGANGSAITTLTNSTSYTMVYYAGKFRVTAIN